MTSQIFLQLCLVLHITGFTMMAGTIIASYSMHRKLNRHLMDDKHRAIVMLDGMAGFPALIGIGALLLVASGIGMVVIFKAAVTSMLWFRIKMILVISIMVIGGRVPRQHIAKLKVLLAANTGESNGQIVALKGRMGLFHAVQLTLFLTVFVLSIFRF